MGTSSSVCLARKFSTNFALLRAPRHLGRVALTLAGDPHIECHGLATAEKFNAAWRCLTRQSAVSHLSCDASVQVLHTQRYEHIISFYKYVDDGRTLSR